MLTAVTGIPGWMFGIVLILAFLALTAPYVYRALDSIQRGEVKKHKIEPKRHLMEPGICYCGDGVNYHPTLTSCNVPGCHCGMYVDSSTDEETLKEVTQEPIARIALAAINSKRDYEDKRKMIERSY